MENNVYLNSKEVYKSKICKNCCNKKCEDSIESNVIINKFISNVVVIKCKNYKRIS